ncbi:MAG TPA: hypothetical protein PKV66_00570 [Candidatus Pelethenecus sp.]|nr:hypothetical protein [Candidatus Pelethenecus sp.]
MVPESVKRLSEEEQQLYIDLDETELLFYRTKDKKVRIALNKLRYLIIVRIHEIREGEF